MTQHFIYNETIKSKDLYSINNFLFLFINFIKNTAFLAIFKRLRQAQAPAGTCLSRLGRHVPEPAQPAQAQAPTGLDRP